MKVALGLLMISPSIAVWKLNMMPAMGAHGSCLEVWFSGQPEKTHVKAPMVKFF